MADLGTVSNSAQNTVGSELKNLIAATFIDPNYIYIKKGADITISDFSSNKTLDIFVNASINVSTDNSSNIILDLHDGNNNSSKVTLVGANSSNDVYNLPSFLNKFKVVFHYELNDNGDSFCGLNTSNASYNINGGDGNDTIIGGAGNDTITGGAGADRFYLGSGTNEIVINNLYDSTSIPNNSAWGSDRSIDTTTMDHITGLAEGDRINTVALMLSEGDNTTPSNSLLSSATSVSGASSLVRGIYDADNNTFTVGVTGADNRYNDWIFQISNGTFIHSELIIDAGISLTGVWNAHILTLKWFDLAPP